MGDYIANIALGWVVASLALELEHILLWHEDWRLAEPYNYIVGVLTILAGCAVWAWRQVGPIDPWLSVIAFSFISTSGAWVVVSYWLRGRWALIKKRTDTIAARKSGIAEALDDTLDTLRRN